jgi:SAM-dependent methyltransferase
MRLWQVRKHWNALAERDPLWAVLTKDEKAGGRWNAEEFFATGLAEVERDLASIRQSHPGLGTASALDFGCGVGRLTQGLARHFGEVRGVDISEHMIALAREHCRLPNVRFDHNVRADLRAYPDGAFDLVYSRITLQHIAPAYSLGYLREFVRVLAPGGAVSVQVPASVPAGDPPDRFEFSPWPPTLWMRLMRSARYRFPGWFPGTPKMQMYALSETRVRECLEAAGAQVIAVEASERDGISSRTYLACRRAP